MAIANDQIMKRIGMGIAADISHSIAEIRKPCVYPLANLLAAGILRPARIYSITRRILIEHMISQTCLMFQPTPHVC